MSIPVQKYLLIKHRETNEPATVNAFDSEEARRIFFVKELENTFYKDGMDSLIANHKFHTDAVVDEKTFEFMRVYVASVEEFVKAINPTKDPTRTFKLTDIKTIENQIKSQSFLDAVQGYIEVQQSNHYYNTATDESYTFVNI